MDFLCVKGKDQSKRLVSALSAAADRGDRLWLLDTGSIKMGPRGSLR